MMRETSPQPARRVRCALYTRKSTEEGLEREFNSLDAQREAAEAYVASQKAEGWLALPERYDDGGYTGGNMDRPALQRLLADVEAGKVDCVVVYKVDRLSRSLLDFSRIVEAFDRRSVSFVSVTQQFNTTSSMGRLTLNILLSFAQFEREIIGERIRDKVAAAKRKGKHTGGMPVLGYDIDHARRRLVVNEQEAALVRQIFQRFLQLGSTVRLAREINEQGRRTKAWTTVKGKQNPGRPWNTAHLYRLLNNRKYLGEVEHQGQVYPGEQEAIVPRALWDEVHAVLARHHRARANQARAATPGLLKGLVSCGHCGGAMGLTFTKRRGRLYRYYLCVQAAKQGYDACPVRSVAAGEVERAVLDQLRAVFRSPELVARTFRAAQGREADEIERLRAAGGRDRGAAHRTREAEERLRLLRAEPASEQGVSQALRELDPLWNELFPAEQARIVRLLIEGVTVHPDGLELRLRAEGLRSLLAELRPKAALTAADGPLVLRLPLRFRRRSGRKVILAAEGLAPTAPVPPQAALVVALARAFRWRELLETGRFSSMSALASHLDLDRRYVGRTLELSLLAPDLLQAILDGHEPDGLGLRQLATLELPALWDEQRRVLGVARAN